MERSPVLRASAPCRCPAYRRRTKTDELFLLSSAALREVVDQIDPADFSAPVPENWSQLKSPPTLLGVMGRHAYDEARIPDVMAGRASADGDPFAEADLLGDDPVASGDALNDAPGAAVRSGECAEIFRFTYGDYSASEWFAHLSMYRAFQAWSIAKPFGIPFHRSPEPIAGRNEHVVPHADEWRQWGVFPPTIEPPANADYETRLLCAVGSGWSAGARPTVRYGLIQPPVTRP